MINVKKPKKRGRKSKKEKEEMLKKEKEEGKPVKKLKKRGRKPKGGKIIKAKDILNNNEKQINPNIILHLKCSTDDFKKYGKGELLEENINLKIKSFNTDSGDFCNVNDKNEILCKDVKENDENNLDSKITCDKLKKLKINLRHNNVLYKRAACFWCTYEFDNPPIFIPKNKRENNIEVYGCFCSPECACSYLKKESLDDSTRWERYALLNNLYGKVYNYEKNIKPAPSPYYTLDKYYGNLTIKEYRNLLKNERLIMIVDKPLTKILPELYEENNEIPDIFNNLLNNKPESCSSKYRLKRNGPEFSKSSILSANFNL